MQNRIRELRLGKGMSIRQLEQKAGLGPGTLGRWERDQVMPRVDLAYYIAQVLGVSIEYMMGWEENDERK